MRRHVFDGETSSSFRVHLSDAPATPKHGFAKCPTDGEERDTSDSAAHSSISLRALLPDAKFFGCDDVHWTGLAMDVAHCVAGEVVVFRAGEGDPNELISQAMALGASGILTEQMLPCPIPQCIVGSVDRALAEIASATEGSPDRKLLTVGVLGTSGKTSTCLLMATVTNAMGIRTAFQCDLGSHDGVIGETPARQLPHGAELIRWLGEAYDCGSRIALVEIDENAARQGRFDSLQFDVLVVAGRSSRSDDFGPSGLDCLLDRLTPKGVVLLLATDSKASRSVETSGHQYVTYGTGEAADFAARIVDQSGGMTTLMLSSADTNAMMETPLCGRAMADNIASATALAGLLGHSLAASAKNLSALRSIPGRGQRLVEFGSPTVVLESAGGVDRLVQSLKTAKAVGVGGKVWCVFATGNEDDSETLAAYGHALERHAHRCVVTSRTDAGGSFLDRSHQILDGVQQCAELRLVADFERAVAWSLEVANANDTIVICTNASRDASAAEERAELQRIEALVDSLRQPVEVTELPVEGKPISLKLFP
ncbi:MAG: Mur ligase family protein [Planctomycetota bacterium]